MLNINIGKNSCTGIVEITAPDNFDKVQQNCVLTPADMEDALVKGVPISQFMASDSYFDDGSDSPVLLAIEQRGIDINDVWNTTKDIKNKIKKVYKNGIDLKNGIDSNVNK